MITSIFFLPVKLIDLIIYLSNLAEPMSDLFFPKETIEDFDIFRKANFSLLSINSVKSIEACM